MAEQSLPQTGVPLPNFKHIEDFADLSANNTQYESSVWDLKMIFGLLDQSETPPLIQQHTSVSISWPQAKVSAYFLMANVLLGESVNGPIYVPSSILPPRPDVNDPALDEGGRRIVLQLTSIYDQLFGGKLLPPQVPEPPK
jgi:hypothetical protein